MTPITNKVSGEALQSNFLLWHLSGQWMYIHSQYSMQ